MKRDKKRKNHLSLLLALALSLALCFPAVARAAEEDFSAESTTSSSESLTEGTQEDGEEFSEEDPAEDGGEEDGETPAETPAVTPAPKTPASEEPVYYEEPEYDFTEVSNEEFERLRQEGAVNPYQEEDAAELTTREATGAKVVRVPATIEDFRFWTVARHPAFATKELSFREKKDGEARVVATLDKDGVLYILEDRQDGWYYAESGEARGFVKADEVLAGEEAEKRYAALIRKAAKKHDKVAGGELYQLIDAPAPKILVPRAENGALTYLRATVHSVVADKIYALAKENGTYLYEEKDESSRRVGVLPANGLTYVLEGVTREEDSSLTNPGQRWMEDKYTEMIDRLLRGSEGGTSEGRANVIAKLEKERANAREKFYKITGTDEWLYVESGDARGFVKSSELTVDDALQIRMRDAEEATYKKASVLTRREDNAALYYTLTSIRSGVPGGTVKESIVDYAAQFIGNPYVWGGTDPVRGADCSGFVQTIYRQYGYALPRLAQQQAMVGTMIDVADAEPGDLIFYQNGKGEIYHVVIYAGNGETVEAANRVDGIVRGYVAGDACWAVRVIEDETVTQIPETYDNYPVGTNNCYTVTHHYGTRDWAYPCRRIYLSWVEAGSVYTDNVATIDGYYLIACTPLFGTVGDIITWYFDDGSTLDTIMADTKSSSDPNYTPWGHITGNVINVVEFETDQLVHPGTAGCIPQIAGKRVTGWKNLGRGL